MAIWKKNILFKDFTEDELSVVQSFLRERAFEKDFIIVKEGEKGDEVYFIESGRVSILKNDSLSNQSYQIDVLSSGEVFGEMNLIHKGLRNATVRALEPVKTQELLFTNLAKAHPEIARKIYTNLDVLLASRLSIKDSIVVRSLQKELIHIKKRTVMSSLIITTIVMMTVYQIIIQAALNFFPIGNLVPLLALLIIIVGYLAYEFAKKSGYPLKMYGITTRNWKRAAKESILYTLPWFFALTFLKYLYILFSQEYALSPLFAPTFTLGLRNEDVLPGLFNFIVYIPSSIAQELIFRGILQSSLQRFLISPRRFLAAILVTNLLYTQAHFHFTAGFIFLMPGVFWSWLMLRHRTLVGVSISHILIGVWTFNILGFRP